MLQSYQFTATLKKHMRHWVGCFNEGDSHHLLTVFTSRHAQTAHWVHTHIYFLKEGAYILVKWDCAQENTPGLIFLMSNG